MTGNNLYQIETWIPPVRIISFKASDYFAVLPMRGGGIVHFYNLQGMIHSHNFDPEGPTSSRLKKYTTPNFSEDCSYSKEQNRSSR